MLKIGERFGVQQIQHQGGHTWWHYRLIGSNVYLFGRHLDWYGNPVRITREKVN